MTRNQLALIELLTKHPDLTQAQIKGRLGWDQRMVSRVLGTIDVVAVAGKPHKYRMRVPTEKQRRLLNAT